MLDGAPLDVLVGVVVGVVVDPIAASQQAVSGVARVRHLMIDEPRPRLLQHLAESPALVAEGPHLQDRVAGSPDDPADSAGTHIVVEQLPDIDVVGEVPTSVRVLVLLHPVQHLDADIEVARGSEDQQGQPHIVGPAPGVQHVAVLAQRRVALLVVLRVVLRDQEGGGIPVPIGVAGAGRADRHVLVHVPDADDLLSVERSGESDIAHVMLLPRPPVS